jgi:hypothetical protein
MKKIFLLTVFLMIFGNFPVPAQDTEKQIAVIRAEVAAINKSAAKYTKKTKNVDDISLEGTEATYYVSGRGLKKIVARIYGESYNATGEYYFTGEELIFAFVKFNKYDRPLGSGGRSPKVARTEEQRFYFSGGNLIRLLIGKKELKPDDERYTGLKDEATATSDKLKESYP